MLRQLSETQPTAPGELLKEAKSFLEDGLVAPQIIKVR